MFEQLSNPWWAFAVLGIFAGIVSGMLGLGGGIILVPTLVLVLGCAQKSAQGTALAVMVPMVLVGAIRYWRNEQVDMDILVIGLIVCGSIVGALIGTELASRLPAHILRRLFSIFLVIVAARMFIGSSGSRNAVVDDSVAGQNKTNVIQAGGAVNESER